MQLEPLDPNGNAWNERVLASLGAYMISYPEGSGPVVDPEIDLSGYVAAAAAWVKSSLIVVAQQKQAALAAAGITVSTSQGDVRASTDTASLTLLQGAFTVAQAHAEQSFQWVQDNGVAVTLSSADISAIFSAVVTHLQATFATLASVIASINDGDVTTADEVSIAFD